MDVVIREFNSVDLSSIVKIEQNAQSSPWGRISFEESLNRGHFCRVLESSIMPVGYSVSSQIADELHILNLVVAPQFQGQGFGHELMHDVFSLAKAHKLVRVFLEVRESNDAALSLYQKWGFKQISLRKNYYRSRSNSLSRLDPSVREHAIVMLRNIEQ